MSEVHLLSLSDNNHYPYQIIQSSRAKYVRIKLSNSGDLCVVLPRGISAKFAHKFIKDKALWVEKNLQKMPDTEPGKLPEKLDLLLLSEYWTIEYVIDDNQRIHLTELPGQKLRVSGETMMIGNTEILYKSINQWCRKKAKKTFNHMLEQLAEEHGFHYQSLSIRTQKTRWGSCSNKKNINLNAKLLFMPTEVVRYVMIHELCHTIEMNHSHRFWALVEECDPNFKKNRSLLKRMGKEIIL